MRRRIVRATRKEAVMRPWGSLVILIVLVAGLGPVAQGGDRSPDLAIQAVGTEATGQALTLTCGLHFALVPSNMFVGQCRIAVGSDRLLLDGLPRMGARLLTVVMNGSLALQGRAAEGTGRFESLVARGTSGFPLLVRLDPLGRTWAITSDLPGGGTQTVAQGTLGTGMITLAMPDSK
jgi:hypothetical protein